MTTYRSGRGHGDLIYQQHGREPSKSDPRIAVCASESWATFIISVLKAHAETRDADLADTVDNDQDDDTYAYGWLVMPGEGVPWPQHDDDDGSYFVCPGCDEMFTEQKDHRCSGGTMFEYDNPPPESPARLLLFRAKPISYDN